MEHGVAQIYQREKQCERHYSSAQHHSQPKRLIAEAENSVHGIFEEPGKRFFGFACGPPSPFVINNCRWEADPGAQSGKITVSFREIDDGIGCLAVQKTKNARI